MKLLGKNRDGSPDGAIDSLLRAYVSRPGDRECSEFDADLANAYIERALTPASRSRYEQHLSECGDCRKNVIALSRLAESEARPVVSARADSRFARVPIFGVASWARWAMAAAAVIVLAISFPLLLKRNSSRVAQEDSQAAAESRATDHTQATIRSPEATPGTGAQQSEPVSRPSAEASKPSEKRPVDAVSSNGPAATQQAAGSGGDRTASNGRLEAKTESKAANQADASAGSQPSSEVAAGQAEREKRSDQGALSARQQPSKDTAVADTKATGDEQDKENAGQKEHLAENAATPPPPSAPVTKAGKVKRSPAMRALRESSTTEAVSSIERKVGAKKFLLKNDTWTDKDFDPDKDLPVVTVVRDSNVYSELLARQSGLKPYLGGFPPADRAIIVYRGTVYKLIPQQ